MPPNPERQAKMAAKRLAFDNDPDMQSMAKDVGQKVLDSYKNNPEIDAVKPRQMLPNYYKRGGKVISCKDY